MIFQLDPSILVETPLGTGLALFVIDKGLLQNSCWVIALAKDGIIKHFDCNDVSISADHTFCLNFIRIKEFHAKVVTKNKNIET